MSRRDEDFALVREHRGFAPFRDRMLVQEAFDRLGPAALSDEALAIVAEGYREEERREARLRGGDVVQAGRAA